jgi:trk system potassium uptake protein TrkH
MALQGAESLAYAARGTAVLRLLGELCKALAGVALVPTIFAVAAGDWPFARRAAAVGIALAALAYASTRLPAVRRLQTNEAMAAVAIGYLATALLMSWPLATGGLAPIDAVFHSVSAVTTTGLSTAGGVESLSASVLFTQAWMQWCGGLAIVVLAVLLMEPGPAARRLSDTDLYETDALAGARQRARWALIIYAALTGLGLLGLAALGAGWFDALIHALSAISTGGFSSHDDSLAGLGAWPVQSAVMLLALAGAIPLARYRALASGRPAGLGRLRGFLDAETRTLLVACAVLSAMLVATLALASGLTWQQALRAAPLLAVSAQSTAGFTPVEVGALDDSSKLLLTVSMFTGGGLGSTAGGIKIFRLLILLRLIQLSMLRAALPPHAVAGLRVDGRRIDDAGLVQAVGIVACFAVVVLVSWLAFVLHGHDPLDSLFEVVSATATVGLSTGLAAPQLEPLLKVVLCADMWMGRLEVLAVLVLLHPRSWIGRRAGSS